MLEVSRDAVAAGEEKLVSFAAEQSNYCFICTVTLGLNGDLPFTSRGCWQCPNGGDDAGLNSCYEACGCGAEHRSGVLLGKDVWRSAWGDGAHWPFLVQRGDGANIPSQSNGTCGWPLFRDFFCEISTLFREKKFSRNLAPFSWV
jgi:hypothetical protein